MAPVKIVHFSDVLCVWAYVGQDNLYRLVQEFGDKVDISVHFCSVFPDAHTKIKNTWRDRGGFDGYGAHVRDVVAGFDGIALHDGVWSKTQPRSSASPQLFICAIELLEQSDPAKVQFADRLSVRAAKELRNAFFADGQDIAKYSVQRTIADRIGMDFDEILKGIESGEAIARLAADYDLSQSLNVQGSPTYILNEGRQRLFGNIGYSILAANVSELITDQSDEIASLCS
jgi:predicted DsbA family dithiol-disulfide isomerase